MAVRNIIKIDEEKCNGCGKCVNACAEGALKIINGKAKLVNEVYCDGLGACIGECPQGALTIEKLPAAEFDEQAVKEHLQEMKKPVDGFGFVCPGMKAASFRKKGGATSSGPVQSQLSHWPVQLKLVSPQAPYFVNADLLVVADCVPFAMGDFHNKFLKDHSVVVGCPKLDDREYYVEKLADIIKVNKLNSLTVIHMEVPCCSGLTEIPRKAVALTGTNLRFEDVTIALDGAIIKTEIIGV